MTKYLPLSAGGSYPLRNTLYHHTSVNIINSTKHTSKTYNEGTTWYQDLLQHVDSDNNRISVIRSSITTEGRSELTLGVSNVDNASPEGLLVRRTAESEGKDNAVCTVPKNTLYSWAILRNISAGTSSKTSGTSPMNNGEIYVQYE